MPAEPRLKRTLEVWRWMGTGATLASADALSIGLRLAFTVGHHADRVSGLRAVARELSRVLDAPVAAWREGPDRGRLVHVSDDRLRRGEHETLVADAGVWAASGSRRRRVEQLGEIVRRLAGTSGVTTVDLSFAVLVVARHCPELEAVGRDLAALLLRLPDTELALEWPTRRDPLQGEDDGVSTERFRIASLTYREREVLVLLEGGEDTGSIAHLLTISRNTVKTHVQNILAKLDVGSRLEAAALARRSGVPMAPAAGPQQLRRSE